MGENHLSPHGSYQSPDEIEEAIRDIKSHLLKQDETYDDRRKEDDKREERSQKERAELLRRVDDHGKRTTVLEVKHEAFFGEQGAYRHIVKTGDDNAKKLDKIFWAIFALSLAITGAVLKSILHL